jgi:hypothetical protein
MSALGGKGGGFWNFGLALLFSFCALKFGLSLGLGLAVLLLCIIIV